MSRSGMAGGLSNRNFRISLSHMPDAKRQYTVDFNRLDGGLNLYELNYRLNPNESPDMRNLLWKNGALSCRDGQYTLIKEPSNNLTAYAAYTDLFWGVGFVHIGQWLYCFDPAAENPRLILKRNMIPQNRGTFFRYGDYLMYKNKGGYYQIAYNPDGASLSAKFPITSVEDHEFIPVTYINANPTTVAGTAYQPENRLSKSKTIWYTAVQDETDYYLPYGSDDNHPDSVSKVIVDGVTQTAGTDYSVHIDTDNKTAFVRFSTAPPVHTPTEANTVRITYHSTGTDAYNSVMSCPYAIVYGGDQNLCVVVGGCEAQPNAYFWSGNDELSMNPFYFPMEHYNFAGDTESPVTGFGRQQGFLVVFSEKGVGRANFGTTTTTSDRLQIEMPYTAINSKFGCEYPWSIQLVDNNLVFCNREHGVCFLSDSSAAHENNIIEIGRKINGTVHLRGLAHDLDKVGTGDVHSTIFEDKYWLAVDGNVYLWDFRLSESSNPTWFFYNNIHAVEFIREANRLYHLDERGRVTVFRNTYYSDYGEPIEKVYQFATQMMGTYDHLKNVMSIIVVTRSSSNTNTQLKYITDYEERYDLTPLQTNSWALVPRNLAFRYLGVSRFAMTYRRRPMCRHVRHFAMRLENNEPGADLNVISAQLYYNYQGVQR